MSVRVGRLRTTRRMLGCALMALALAAVLAACQKEADTAVPEARPVRTATIEKREGGVPLTFTGRIEAEDEVVLAFRISGRLLESNGRLGDRVQAGQT